MQVPAVRVGLEVRAAVCDGLPKHLQALWWDGDEVFQKCWLISADMIQELHRWVGPLVEVEVVDGKFDIGDGAIKPAHHALLDYHNIFEQRFFLEPLCEPSVTLSVEPEPPQQALFGSRGDWSCQWLPRCLPHEQIYAHVAIHTASFEFGSVRSCMRACLPL